MAATETVLRYLRPTGARTTAIIVWTLRVIVGAIFIFSGWVKAVDIWGGTYKIGEYLNVWHIALPDSVTALSAGALAMAEFTVGVMLLLGCFRRGRKTYRLIYGGYDYTDIISMDSRPGQRLRMLR